MAKATIKTKDGTSIVIEGSDNNVVNIINKIKGQTSEPKKEELSRPKSKKTSSKITMTDLIEELKEEKFFDKPKSLLEIKKAFENKGHIYDVNAISTPILRLVRRRILGRINQDGKWAYVKR